ncbi:MAG: hypothetical protein ACI4JT_05255 [Oscillospiraceae bacterium]
MTNQGFVKVPRQLLSWRWYSNRNVRLVFLDLLMRAAWSDGDFLGVMLHRGQVAVSVQELATSNQLTVQQTRTALDHLKSTGDITTESTPKYTIITLNLYDELQGVNKPDNVLSTNTTAENQQTPAVNFNKPTYYNKKKEIKEKEEEMPAAQSKSFYSKKSVRSANSSFTLEDIMSKINAR